MPKTRKYKVKWDQHSTNPWGNHLLVWDGRGNSLDLNRDQWDALARKIERLLNAEGKVKSTKEKVK